MDDWNDIEFATDWDRHPTRHNPARRRQLAILERLVGNYTTGSDTVLELGIGSGLVAHALLARFPDLRLWGVDASETMLELARHRLSEFAGRTNLLRHDLRALTQAPLPPAKLVFASQSLHEIPHPAKRAVFSAVKKIIPAGGALVVIDRIPLDPRFRVAHRAVWESHFTDSFDAYVDGLTGKEDHPATPEELLAWLGDAGFRPACLDVCFNRALLIATA